MNQEMKEIESLCSRFQYSTTRDSMAEIQDSLNQVFKTQIKTKVDLFQQLSLCLQLLQFSTLEILHSLVQAHLKVLLTTKHHLVSSASLQALSSSLVSHSLHSNRVILSGFLQLHAIITVLGWADLPGTP